MLLPNRAPVIENMQNALAEGRQNDKVELGDPQMTAEEGLALVESYVAQKDTAWFKTKSWFANKVLNILSRYINRDTEFVGLERLEGLVGGAFLTSNHFNPIDSTITRRLALKFKRSQMAIVSQDTNLKMTGLFGFFMTNLNIIPMTNHRDYLQHSLPTQFQQELDKGNFILIYPEQEMWFNYRRPRQPKRGAYLYAAQLQAPIISCFTEMLDRPEAESADFYRQRYRLHILGVIYPDEHLTVLENSRAMCRKDFELKKAAYERIYGKDWAAPFDPSDIAGWRGSDHGE